MSMYATPTGMPGTPHGHGNGMQGQSPNGGMQDLQKANHSCSSCRKQKRKCSKTLPACALCERMNRHCDYSDAVPAPSAEDFNILRMRVMELESRVPASGQGHPNGMASPPTTYSAGTPSAPDPLAPHLPLPAYTHAHAHVPPQDLAWQNLQNRFPAFAFLDSEQFKTGGVPVPKQASLEIPVDALQLLGDAASIQDVFREYFATIHKWIPIVSQKRMERNFDNPMWEGGPDLALLFLCMKLMTSRPQDGIYCLHNPIYACAKRFLALMEATGAVSLIVLQAAVLITWYEYGQAIYPAAWMTAGWCVRYGNLLGINNHSAALQLLGRPSTWTEQEERRRTWWGVLITDRLVSIGSQGHILTSQEPADDTQLPVNDNAWDEGEMEKAAFRTVSSPVDEPTAPFPRLCQASILMGKVLNHFYGENFTSESNRFAQASKLYVDIGNLSRKLLEDATISPDPLIWTSPLALTYSALFALCEKYSCPAGCEGSSPSMSSEAAAMQNRAVEGLKTLSRSIIDFVQQINTATPSQSDLDKISPIIMDSLYNAAGNYAWMVRESGDAECEVAYNSIRNYLNRFGLRWRNAAEYVRLLDAQHFQHAMGSVIA